MDEARAHWGKEAHREDEERDVWKGITNFNGRRSFMRRRILTHKN